MTIIRSRTTQALMRYAIPSYFKEDPMFDNWRRFVTRTYPHDPDFFFTITFKKRQHDDVCIQQTNFFFRLINSYLTDQRYKKTGRLIEGFVFAQRHIKSINKEGGLHFHVLGNYSENFVEKPTLEKLDQCIMRAIPRVTDTKGNQMLTVNELDLRDALSAFGLFNYGTRDATKTQLNENLHNNILLFTKDGRLEWEPDLDHNMKPYMHSLMGDNGIGDSYGS